MTQRKSGSISLFRKWLAAWFAVLYFAVSVGDTDLLHHCSDESGGALSAQQTGNETKTCCESNPEQLRLRIYQNIRDNVVYPLRVSPQMTTSLTCAYALACYTYRVNKHAYYGSYIQAGTICLRILHSVFRL
jgi:hypothetical protein